MRGAYMIETHLENIGGMVVTVLFQIFIASIILLAILLILSLLLLILGSLIKSQTLKSKFLKASISILFMLSFILAIPYIIVAFRSFI
jgi:hypothetical protein